MPILTPLGSELNPPAASGDAVADADAVAVDDAEAVGEAVAVA
jgi:hypothetical protein